MSFFKKNNKKKTDNIEKEVLVRIAQLQQLSRRGLLYVDIKQRKVIITSTLAVLFMGDKERWDGFMSNVNLWFHYTASQLLWNKIFLDEEIKAVREARKKYASLTSLQERTIRFDARKNIDPSVLPAPKIASFDFIVSSDIADGKDASVIVVGRYDKGKLTMVPFDELNE